MKASQIRESIKTRHLRLAGMERFTHFEPVFYLLFIAIAGFAMLVYDWLLYKEFRDLEKTFSIVGLFFLLPTALAVVLYFRQIRQLRLTRIMTSLSRDEIRKIVIELADRNKWEVKNNRKNLVILKTHPPFLSGSWGEQITLLLDERTVWVNSICDPEKRASIVSMGRNKENVEILIHALSS